MVPTVSRLSFGALAALMALVLSSCGGKVSIETSRVEVRSGAPRVQTLAAPPAPVPAEDTVEVAAPQQPPALPPPSLAVIIGVDRAKGASQLQGAVRDATTLRDALVAYGWPTDKIQMLLEGEATTEGILAAIERLARAPTDSRAVFAFAGHTRRIGGQNHIVTADGRLLSAGRLAAALGKVQAPLWVALPTCYAAGFAVPGIVAEGRIATFASQADQVAYEDTTFGRSYLFQYMIAEAMLGRKASGSVEQAFSYAARELRNDKRSTPVLHDQYPGEFVLGNLPPLPPAPAEGSGDGPSGEEEAPADEEHPEDVPKKSTVRACGPYVAMGGCGRG